MRQLSKMRELTQLSLCLTNSPPSSPVSLLTCILCLNLSKFFLVPQVHAWCSPSTGCPLLVGTLFPLSLCLVNSHLIVRSQVREHFFLKPFLMTRSGTLRVCSQSKVNFSYITTFHTLLLLVSLILQGLWLKGFLYVLFTIIIFLLTLPGM